MKINRFTALASISLLVMGGMGAIATRSFAQGTTPPAATQTVEDPSSGPDTDTIHEQVGQQIEDGQPDDIEAPGEQDAGAQDPSYAGSVAMDQAQTEGMNEADEAAALAANPGSTVIKTELDNENGSLVYSVELSNGMDVKIDAGDGSILFTDSEG